MGARLRLKAGKDISTFPASVQKIFRAFKKYGLIVADNGSNMYISGTYDTRWDNDILNPAFDALKASDFEVVQRGWAPPVSLVITLPSAMGWARPQTRPLRPMTRPTTSRPAIRERFISRPPTAPRRCR